ncbi:MAG: hypothetical protein H0W64_04500 [Gammaproteobacteria bacterium]|nr:hypothetical protein [Gammaproteobacteria bacterium]
MFNNRQKVYTKGNTDLHNLLRHCKNAEAIEYMIKVNGAQAVSLMATTVNDAGEIPFDLVENLKVPDTEKGKIYDILLSLTSMKKLKDLNTPLEFSEIIKEFNPAQESRLYRNLKEACRVANITRAEIHGSSTHPSPKHNFDEISQIEKQIKSIEKSSGFIENTALRQLGNQYEVVQVWENEVVVELPQDIAYHFLQSKTDLYEKKGMANCGIMSFIALKKLIEKNGTSIPAEVYNVQNGDHAILIIDRDPQSDPLQPKTWGPHAVVCDTWSGEVYPLTFLNEKLLTFRIQLMKHKITNEIGVFHFLTSYNPNYHRLSYCLSIGQHNYLPVRNDTMLLRLQFAVNKLFNFKTTFSFQTPKYLQGIQKEKITGNSHGLFGPPLQHNDGQQVSFLNHRNSR